MSIYFTINQANRVHNLGVGINSATGDRLAECFKFLELWNEVNFAQRDFLSGRCSLSTLRRKVKCVKTYIDSLDQYWD